MKKIRQWLVTKLPYWLGGLLAAVSLPIIFSYSLGSQDQPKVGQGGYVGTKACLECHQDKALTKTAHGFAEDPRSPAAKTGCETCHGPGKKHVDGDEKDIKTFGKKSNMSVADQSANCLTCHEKGKVALWNGSSHHERGIGCNNCHKVHGGHEKNLMSANKTEACIQCHKQVRADLQRMSHHPVKEGKVNCVDCHNPHGTVADKLISANSVNDKCYECHTEKRGPFLFDHAPVRESCVTCHKPHGSSSMKLLAQKVPLLCQNCHSESGHNQGIYTLRADQFGQGAYATNTLRMENKGCVNCHSQIHGSNHSSGKMFTR